MIKTFLFILLVSFVCQNAVAVSVCDAPGASESVRIYFANGMRNSESDRDQSTNALASAVQRYADNAYGQSVNTKENPLLEFYEVFLQRVQDPVLFWLWINKLSIAPIWFRDDYVSITNSMRSVSYADDLDLQIMVAQYLRDLRSGKKVVIVAHSQGNFYANSAYLYIKDNYPQYQNSIGIIGVGSPASVVQGGGPHSNNSEDFIVNLVGAIWPVLPATGTYDEPWSVFNHDFIDTYMHWFEGQIVGNVNNTVDSLQLPPLAPECGPAEVETLNAISVSYDNAQLAANLTSGKDVHVWFNIQEGSNPASCSSTAGAYQDAGPYGLGGGTVYHDADQYISLLPNHDYFYKACEKNIPGEVNEGAIKRFRTTNQHATDVNTNSATATFTTADLVGYVQSGNYIDTWFSVSVTSSVACVDSYDGIGTWNTGDTHYATIDKLLVDQTYYYRFRGEGYNGINAGSVKSFTTLAPSIVVYAAVPSKCAGVVLPIGQATITIRSDSIGLDINSITHDAPGSDAFGLPALPSTITFSNGVDISWSGPASDGLTCLPVNYISFTVNYTYTGHVGPSSEIVNLTPILANAIP